MSELPSTSSWIKFFTDAGIFTEKASNYAVIFANNDIKQDMIQHLDKDYLRDMGITIIGDVIAILQHARSITGQMSTDSKTQSSSGGGSTVICRQTSFKDRLQTLRVQHAVAQGGQHIFLLVLTTLFLGGDLSAIKEYIEKHLGSKRQFKDSFTKPEQKKLESGDYKTWDISLIFKVLQKVCGLNPNVSDWKSFGRDTLEKLLDELKDVRNEMAHSIDVIFTEKERDDKLEEFRILCFDILTQLNVKAKIGDEAVHNNYGAIEHIIDDVKKPINESSLLELFNGSNAAPVAQVAKSSPSSLVSDVASASAGPPIFGTASASACASACASASSNFPKSAFGAAAAYPNSAAGKGFSFAPADYRQESAEDMEVDDDYSTSWSEKSIISQLVKSFWEIAGDGFITV